MGGIIIIVLCGEEEVKGVEDSIFDLKKTEGELFSFDEDPILMKV